MPQTTCLSTSGRFLLDPSGLRIILRGINLQTWDDPDFPATNAAKACSWADANSVRIQWYSDYTNSGSRTAQLPIADLVTVLDACRQLAWSWGPDWCAARNISQNGAYPAHYTPYGADIINNTIYGLSQAAPNYGRW